MELVALTVTVSKIQELAGMKLTDLNFNNYLSEGDNESDCSSECTSGNESDHLNLNNCFTGVA